MWDDLGAIFSGGSLAPKKDKEIMADEPTPTEHERHLLGISQGWQEASDYALKKATEKFLAGDTAGAVALRNIGNQMRDTAQRIEDEATQ